MPSPYKPDTSKICFKILANPLHNPLIVARVRDFIVGASKSLGWGEPGVSLAPITSGEEAREELEGCSASFLVLASGGTEHIVLEALETVRGRPSVVASIPLANSLSSLLEVKPVAGGGVAFLHIPGLDPSDPEALSVFEAGLRGLWASAVVKGSRVGIIGDPSPWLVYSLPNGEGLKRLGVELVRVDAKEFVARVTREKPPLELGEKIVRGAEDAELAPGEPGKSLRVYSALKRLAGELELRAVTPACWWFYKDTGANACLAHTILNDEGVVVGCEGDVPSTIAMLLATYASGSPAFFANIADIRGDRVLIAHCTAPLSLGERYRLTRHFITGGSVTCRVRFKPYKQWTLVRLDPQLEKLRVAIGETLDRDPGLQFQCESQLVLRVKGARRLFEDSMGNHHIAVPGDSRMALRIAAEILGLRVEELG